MLGSIEVWSVVVLVLGMSRYSTNSDAGLMVETGGRIFCSLVAFFYVEKDNLGKIRYSVNAQDLTATKYMQ